MDQRIFRYELQDAWGNMITHVEIVDSKKSNVRCMYFSSPRWGNVFENMSSGYVGTISSRQLEDIKEIFLANEDIFFIEDIEKPVVIDGVINNFEFHYEELSNTIRAFNIWKYQDKHHPAATKGNLVLKVFNSIYDVLKTCGMDMRYLSLDSE